MSPRIVNALQKGFYEIDEAKQINQILTDNERVLEIGGGIGFISALVANNPRVQQVRVIEANPDLIPFAQHLHAINGIEGVEFQNVVLSNSLSAGHIDFFLREDFWASSLEPLPSGYLRKVQVPLRHFGTEIDQFRPSLIICDIEGGELDLFEKAELVGVRKVLMEIHQDLLGGDGVKRLFDAMSARQFHYDQFHSSGSVVLFSRVEWPQ